MAIQRSLFLAVCVCFGFAVAACGAGEDGTDPGSSAQGVRAACEAVRCALPLCTEDQHLVYAGGSCCPSCVGPTSRCATVLCLAVACDEGEILVSNNGDCCGHCVPTPARAECNADADCPQLNCFACPCPVATCQGHQCVSTTPSESTCGSL